jgi:hypothetical protein
LLAFIDGNIRTFLFAGVAALALGCSADAASPDAATGGTVDARTSRIDAMPFEVPDANLNSPDAMPGCVDPNEPNETSAAAFSLSATPVDDNDDQGGAFTGTVQDSDVDWFTYLGSDGGLTGVVDPTIEVVGGSVQICMYLDCTSKPQTFSCPTGTTADADGDLNGCCAATGFTVDDLDCTGGSDDANVYIRVKASGAGVCESYSMTYHY